MNPYSTLTGAQAGAASRPSIYFFQLSDPRCVEFLRELDAGRRPPAAGGRATRSQEWLGDGGKALARLGHLARRALLRLRDPGRAGQVLLRLARRADRLPRAACKHICAKRRALDFDDVPARRRRRRAWSTSSARTSSTSTRCSGRRCCKFAGLQDADQRVRARLPHRRSARRCRSRAAPSSAPQTLSRARAESGVAALLLRRQARTTASRTSTSTPTTSSRA